MSNTKHYIKKLEELQAPKIDTPSRLFIRWALILDTNQKDRVIAKNIRLVYCSSFPFKFYHHGILTERFYPPTLIPM